MRRYYYRSPFGTVLRWSAGTAVLVLSFVVVEWFAVEVLPVVFPYLVVGGVSGGLAWLVLRGRR